ncbi:MAG: signal peptidase I [Clostridia bacterium]|nr:signal peptidase I [Clostridia bacterium]
MSNRGKQIDPTVEQLRQELRRVRYRRQYRETLRSTVSMLVVAAAFVMMVVMWLPVLKISGESMADTLKDGDIVVAWRFAEIEKGDMIVFNGENRKTLIKRVIAQGGDVVDIQEDGAITVNGDPLHEDYVIQPGRGECDIQFPYTVPHSRLFVLGDNRAVSVDSRHAVIGCVAQEQIVGEVVLKIWPYEEFEQWIQK